MEMLFDTIEKFSRSAIELGKLKLIRKFVNVITFIVSKVVASIILFIVFLFLNIGIAVWLGEVTGKYYYGFLMVAGLYFFIFFAAFYLFKNGFRRYIKNNMINYLRK